MAVGAGIAGAAGEKIGFAPPTGEKLYQHCTCVGDAVRRGLMYLLRLGVAVLST